MIINTNKIISITEANQNFSRAAKLTDKDGSVVIFKNNRPKYVLVDLAQNPIVDLTDDEKIDVMAKRVLKKYRPAFEELAK
jgi:antitoxin Phd